jgi:hypothetical protein
MSNMQDILNLIRSFVGQANVLTIPRIFVDLTGDLKAALFLSQCVYWSSRSSQPGVFYKTYQEWEEELSLGRHEIDQCRKRVTRWVKTELRQANGAPVLHYIVSLETIANDLVALIAPQNKDVQTIAWQMDLPETGKSNCRKPANGFAGNRQIESERIKCINTETTNRNYLTEINSNGFASDADASTRKTPAAAGKKHHAANNTLPPEIQESLTRLGWRGSLADVEQAWQEDPERVRQWLWYAKRQGWSCALLRTVLRSPGEYPPELEPGSEADNRRRRADLIKYGILDDDELEEEETEV